ncbi:hypothetical protein FJK98_15595 [Micromonospora sp. HM134]|uniref:hypothetical protein n=1 Tax=Micromonospora sp. HM134 TaxID=2583243 RepID=UPI001198A0BF|nr:hypothetical protein [Micromonospora sp. HM134]QDY08402.1 hypothetical protein FJK98_15595 [Micromonospora sp. HM134]
MVTAAEAVWETAGARLDRIDAALARGADDGTVPQPQAQRVERLRAAVRTDPLARWRDGAVVTDDLDDLLDSLEHLVA